MTYRYDTTDVTYLFDYNLGIIKARIEELIEKYGEEASLSYETTPHNTYLYVWYKRLETEAEREGKVRATESRRRLYENLKKEFGE